MAALTEEVDRTTNSLMMNRHEGDNQRMTMARLQVRGRSSLSFVSKKFWFFCLFDMRIDGSDVGYIMGTVSVWL